MAEGVKLGANSLLGTERSSAGFCGIGAWLAFARDCAQVRQAQTEGKLFLSRNCESFRVALAQFGPTVIQVRSVGSCIVAASSFQEWIGNRGRKSQILSVSREVNCLYQ